MRLSMDPSSKASRCLAVLRDGPATTGEVAAETGLDPHSVGTHMRNLFNRNKVKRTRFTKPSGQGRRECWLWEAA